MLISAIVFTSLIWAIIVVVVAHKYYLVNQDILAGWRKTLQEWDQECVKCRIRKSSCSCH